MKIRPTHRTTATLALSLAVILCSTASRAQPLLPDQVQPVPADPFALPDLGLNNELKKKTIPLPDGPWKDLINQPYFKDNLPLKADRLLFHGQYEDAEILCNELLAKKDLPDDQRQTLTEIRLEAILRQGGQVNLQRFQSQSAQLTSSHMILLRAQALLQLGKFDDALSMLQAYAAAHKTLPADANALALFNLYGQTLESKAQYADAIAAYTKVAAFAATDMPQDPAFRTEVAKANLRAAILSDQGTGVSKRARQSAQIALNAIISMDSTYWPAQVELTRLYFDAQNLKDASASANIVLGLQPYNTEVRLMLLHELITQESFDKAANLIALLKNIDDTAAVDASEGRMFLKQNKTADAIAALSLALDKDPAQLEARGLLAGIYFLRNDPEKAQQELNGFKTADRTPHPVALYQAATLLAEQRQYPQAEKLLKQSSDQAAWWSAPYIALAQVYLALGDLNQAQTAYGKGFALDSYGMATVNQLRLLQLLKNRDIIETPHFIIRYQGPAKPDPQNPDAALPEQTSDLVLAQLAAVWCEKIYPEVTSEYQFQPPGKTTVELYPAHDEFAVRLTGMTQIGTFGASTGNVIALDAPRTGKDLLGNFDWARVIRHEFTHTVTLAMTHNRIPRWLTEAAAVTNEQAPRDWNSCLLLAANLRAGTLFKFSELNAGFIRPKKSTDTALAYAQSQWIYEYLSTTYGPDKLLAFIHCFGDGMDDSAALQSAFGKPADAIYADFLKWAGQQVQAWGLPATLLPSLADAQAAAAKNPADIQAQLTLIDALMVANKVPDAEKAARDALQTSPDNPDLREHLVQVLVAQRKTDAADPILDKLAADFPDRPNVARFMGQKAMTQKKLDDAVKWFEKLEQLRPLDDSPYRSLAAIYLTRKDNKNAILQLEKIAVHEQADERIPRRLAQLLLDEKQLPEAEKWAYESLRIDPYSALNHQLMAQILLAQNDPKQAVTYLTYATSLEPTTAEFWTNLAQANFAANDHPAAAAAAKKALDLDPSAPVKNYLQ